MCDRISQIDAATAATVAAREKEVVVAGNTIGGVRAAGTQEVPTGDPTSVRSVVVCGCRCFSYVEREITL